jgi:ATP-binding cassette, subfamily F, member 3
VASSTHTHSSSSDHLPQEEPTAPPPQFSAGESPPSLVLQARPPPFSSLYTSATPDYIVNKASITEPDPSETASASVGLATAFEPVQTALSASITETKAALPADHKVGSSSKVTEEGEPPPPYSEGSSPLDSFTFTMAAAGGPASIITQVSQGGGGGHPINSLGGT